MPKIIVENGVWRRWYYVAVSGKEVSSPDWHTHTQTYAHTDTRIRTHGQTDKREREAEDWVWERHPSQFRLDSDECGTQALVRGEM